MTNRGVRAGGVCLLGWLVLGAGIAAAERPASMLEASEHPSVVADGDDLSVSGEPRPCTAWDARLPVNVRVPEDLRPRITTMLRRSPTFRRQCRRLAAAPWVHVKVQIDPSLSEQRAYRAMSVIQRPQPNLIIAVVNIQATEDPAIWVAHELEHVIEQLETIDLDTLARGRRSAWRMGRDMFETQRAIRAGEQVFAEVRAPIEEPDNFVDE